jgi:hypothetical protein
MTPIPNDPRLPDARPAWRQDVALLLVVLAIKIVGGLIDPSIHAFLGDSASYLHSADAWWPPTDRSFLYPALIAYTARPLHSLYALVAVQSLCGIAVAWIAFVIARDRLRVRWTLAFAAACLLAAEPAQMFFERMLLTEAPSLLAFGLMLLCGLGYVVDGRAWRLALAVGLGLVAVALRVSLLPFAWAFPVLVVVVRHARRPFAARAAARDLALCVTLTAGLHGMYVHVYARAAQIKPDYVVHAGAYRLGLVAPLVTPRELADAGAPADLLERVQPAPTGDNREAQIWLDHGLINQLRSELGAARADRVAYRIAALTLRRHAGAFLLMQLRTLRSYFIEQDVRFRMNDDLGTRPPDATMIARVRERYGYDLTQSGPEVGLFANAFARSTPWLTACLFLLAPLGGWLAWRGARSDDRVRIAFGACCIGLVANDVLFSHIISFRYLQPFPFFMLIGLAAAIDAGIGRRQSPAFARNGNAC